MKISSCPRVFSCPTYSASVAGRSDLSNCSSCAEEGLAEISRSVSTVIIVAPTHYAATRAARIMLGCRCCNPPTHQEGEPHMSQFRRIVATALIVSTSSLALPQPTYAGMLSTATAITGAERERITQVVNRAAVQAQLQAYGVSIADVNA